MRVISTDLLIQAAYEAIFEEDGNFPTDMNHVLRFLKEMADKCGKDVELDPAPAKLIEHDFGFENCCGGCGTLIAFTRHPIDDGLKSVKRYCTYCGRRINWNEIQRHSSTT